MLISLEDELHSELNVPRRTHVSVPATKRRTRNIIVNGSGAETAGLADKNVLVPRIEKFCLEAQADSFRNSHILDEADVLIREPGAPQAAEAAGWRRRADTKNRLAR
jgi:hypothetical protein